MPSIAIIEDNKNVAEGLKHIITFSDECSVSAVYHSSEESFNHLANSSPDIILLDIYLPGLSGVKAIKKIKELSPEAEIIMLTSSDKDEHIYDSLRAGAAGYLMKNSTASQIIESIRTVLEGGAPMSKEVARKVINSFRTQNTEYEFTRCEQEILHHLADGKTIKEISSSLFVEKTTVKFHLSNIYKKLGVHSKAEAVSKIFKENIL